MKVKVVTERSPIQTAAILICLTGKRGDNLPLHTPGEERGEREVENKKRERAKSKERRAEQNCDKGAK